MEYLIIKALVILGQNDRLFYGKLAFQKDSTEIMHTVQNSGACLQRETTRSLHQLLSN